MKQETILRFAHALSAILLLVLIEQASANQARFIHVAPFDAEQGNTSVDVLVNGTLAVSDLSYREFTPPGSMAPGEYQVSFWSRSDGTELVTASIELQGSFNWIYLIGNGVDQPFEVLALGNAVPFIGGGDVWFHFVHAAPADIGPVGLRNALGEGPGVTIWTTDPFHRNYGSVLGVLRPFGPYDLKVTDADGQVNLLDLAPANLTQFPTPDPIIQLVLIGDGVNQPLDIFTIPATGLQLVDPVDNSSLGWWDTPNTGSSEGLLIQPIPSANRMVGTIYSYAEDGSGDQTWFTFDGKMSGRSVSAVVFSTHGGQLGGDQPSELEAVGELEIEFEDCMNGRAELFLDSGASASWELGRLTRTVPCAWAD